MSGHGVVKNAKNGNQVKTKGGKECPLNEAREHTFMTKGLVWHERDFKEKDSLQLPLVFRAATTIVALESVSWLSRKKVMNLKTKARVESGLSRPT